MMKKTALLLLLLLGSSAHADIRYRIRASYGTLDSFGRGDPSLPQYPKGRFDCDPATQYKLMRSLAKQPVLTIRQNGVIDITFDYDGKNAKLRATRQFKGPKGETIGYWESEIPGLSFHASVLERRTKPPVIQIGMALNITLPDGSVTSCMEQWTGSGDKF